MAIQDDAKNFLLSALSRAGGDLPSLQMEWLATQGYTRGSIDERWSYYLRDNGQPPTGVSWDLLGLTRNKGGGVTFEAETEALVARFTTPPTSARKLLINTLIKALKDGGIWTKLDALYIMAAADAQAARRNWVADAYNLTAVSSPTFTVDRGYAGNGSSSYLATGFTPSTAGGKFLQNDAHLMVVDRTARAANDNNIQMGAGAVSPIARQSLFAARAVGDLIVGKVNDTTVGTTSNANSDGRFVTSRQASGTRTSYRNGASLGSVTATTDGLTDRAILIGAYNNGGSPALFSTDQLAAAGIGGGLSAIEVAAFDTALSTYLTAVGA